MSNETSADTGRRYGLKRVCQTLNFPRSSIRAERTRAKATVTPITKLKRGPKPRVPDAALLQAIQDDLESSPFTGEEHRKVWARPRILRGIRASRERVLRLMREHHLLSPHRGPQGEDFGVDPLWRDAQGSERRFHVRHEARWAAEIKIHTLRARQPCRAQPATGERSRQSPRRCARASPADCSRHSCARAPERAQERGLRARMRDVADRERRAANTPPASSPLRPAYARAPRRQRKLWPRGRRAIDRCPLPSPWALARHIRGFGRRVSTWCQYRVAV
ncbi:hypothetical protein B0G84_8627 [Paraburkholderia sp. BL8N3]|nr:hypothetical protein B0G84_8627 [Paraburkholderia sp. BL8N3]